jgi:hypothetical protein
MQVGHATRATGGGLVASASERAAVAELMTPLESLVGRPPRYLPRSGGALLMALLLAASPNEPPDDDE